MNMNSQPDEQVRLVFLQPGSGRILILGDRGAMSLPTVRIPAYSRHAEEITAAVAREWELESYCLFTLPSDSYPVPQHHYAFSCLANNQPGALLDGNWIDLFSIAKDNFPDERDFTILKAGGDLLHGFQRDLAAGYFGRPGWLEEIETWTREQAAQRGWRRLGRCSQLNASATTSLLRFDADPVNLWFKAAGEPNTREFAITQYLAFHFPDCVPTVIATHKESNGWLSAEASGMSLAADSDSTTWIAVADALARLQRKTLGQTLHLIAAGCIDVRAAALAPRVEPFLEVMSELMTEQTKPCPSPLSQTELKSLKSVLFDAISAAEALNVPSSLLHLDFNLGNVIIAGRQVTFLDWASGGIGIPLIGLEYLLEQLRTLRPHDAALQTEVYETYVRRWLPHIDENTLAAAWAITPLLAAFAYAVSAGAWCDPARRKNPATAGHLRSMTRRMKREAEVWLAHCHATPAFSKPR